MVPHERRQLDTVSTFLPTAVSVSGVVTATATDGLPSSLIFNTAAPNSQPTPTPIPTSSDIDTTPTPSSEPIVPNPSQSSGVNNVSGSSKPISLGTVVGTCVGAFIGASALIIFGIWIYRRYSKSLKNRTRTRGPFVQDRNMRGDQQRRRSKLEPWNKLDDDEDHWDSKTKEVDQVAPMEKLTMFKKTPSVRTAWTHNPADDAHALQFPQSFAPFDPNLAQTLTLDKPNLPEPRPFLGRVDANPSISWDSETGKESFLTVHSNLRSSGAMSPTMNMAIPTPPAVVTEHKWESAEVVNFPNSQSAQVQNTTNNTPFFNLDNQSQEEKQATPHNPFFGATKDYQVRPRSNSFSRSRSGSITRSRSSSLSTAVPEVPLTKSAKAKGKERMRYSQATVASQATGSLDPFADIQSQLPPRPQFVQHGQTGSVSSTESKERALQSLVAALELPEEEVRDRLRIASMQPSILSQASAASTIGPDVGEVARSFPLPPSGAGRGATAGDFGRP
ncbi:hypothetical protein CVT24_010004 [Panaeolus cyanescens]|uniref:Uncharacterized protein n=1 Tax=Panaeolus cyanescens TaxID=181874 RepID=A0A409VY52_9AGAR|nr:hypothetical protein CVT24_010004 [Panaeolus cyanescens]